MTCRCTESGVRKSPMNEIAVRGTRRVLCVDFRMPVVDDVPLHGVRRPKISNERNRGEGYAKGSARSIGN